MNLRFMGLTQAALYLLLMIRCPGVTASWRMNAATLVTTRLDPNVSPGKISTHVHDVVGPDTFGATYDYDTYQKGTCTSVEIQDDKSAYWMPSVYGKEKNGTYRLLRSGYAIYYLHRGEPGQIKAFPKGFQMIAGDPMKNKMNATNPADQAPNYACLYDKGPETLELPKQKCELLRVQVMFPSCWNGKDLTSPNGRDHVVYPTDGKEGKKCPGTHPVRFINIFMEHFINFDDFEWTPGSLVFANGDNVGWSSHGDFVNGWDPELLQKAIDTCDNNFADMNACPILTKSRANVDKCKPKRKIPLEDVGLFNTLTSIPGDNNEWGGGKEKKMKGDEDLDKPFAFPFGQVKAGWKEFGCIAEGRPGSTTLNAHRFEDNRMSPQFCVAECDKRGFKLSGLDGSKGCHCDNELTNGGTRTKVDDEKCPQACSGSRYELCGGARFIRLFEKTGDAGASPEPKFPPAGSKLDKVYTGDGTENGEGGTAVDKPKEEPKKDQPKKDETKPKDEPKPNEPKQEEPKKGNSTNDSYASKPYLRFKRHELH